MKKFGMITISVIMIFVMIFPSAINPTVNALAVSGPIPIPGNLLIPSVGTPINIGNTNLGTVSTALPLISIYSINKVNSGLVASDSLTNETKTQQELQSNPRYWTYGGDAPLQNPPAPYDFYKDSQGLHMGVQSTGTDASGNPIWAGYYAMTPGTNAAVFHATISTPVTTIPTSNNYYENSLYVQTSVNARPALVNYVACGSNTSVFGTVWAVYSATGDVNGATTFTALYVDPSPNQPLTRDCTIITNGSNYLKVYIDGVMVYSSNTLNLQMQEPFNAFLEPQSSYAGQLLNGIYKNYYTTSNENIKVTNNPPLASTVKLVDPMGNVLASENVDSSGTSILNIGQFNMPLAAYIKVYDSNGIELASTSNPIDIFGGDVYTVKTFLGL